MKWSVNWKLILVDYSNGLQRMVWLQTQNNDVYWNEENKVSATDCVKSLGVKIDNKVEIEKQVNTLCSKVTKKINAFLDCTYIFPEIMHH